MVYPTFTCLLLCSELFTNFFGQDYHEQHPLVCIIISYSKSNFTMQFFLLPVDCVSAMYFRSLADKLFFLCFFLTALKPHVWQGRQCAYSVTLRHIRATIVPVEKQWVFHSLSVCICSLRYPACNAHAPYCHLWLALLYIIFPHYLINSTSFQKMLLNIKCVF